jgi:hypothetical protein
MVYILLIDLKINPLVITSSIPSSFVFQSNFRSIERHLLPPAPPGVIHITAFQAELPQTGGEVSNLPFLSAFRSNGASLGVGLSQV